MNIQPQHRIGNQTLFLGNVSPRRQPKRSQPRFASTLQEAVRFGKANVTPYGKQHFSHIPELLGKASADVFEDVVILDGAKRTYFDKILGGRTVQLTESDWATQSAEATLQGAGFNAADRDNIDYAYWGNVNQNSDDAAFMAKHVSDALGIGETNGRVINQLCGSGAAALHAAAKDIAAHNPEDDLFILAGGVERMEPSLISRDMPAFLTMQGGKVLGGRRFWKWLPGLGGQPIGGTFYALTWGLLGKLTSGIPVFNSPVINRAVGPYARSLDQIIKDRTPQGPLTFHLPALVDPKIGMTMGDTAEELITRADMIANQIGRSITADELDIYSAQSHERAYAAYQAGKIQEEAVPVVGHDGAVLLNYDSSVRANFDANGTPTELTTSADAVRNYRAKKKPKYSKFHQKYAKTAKHMAANASAVVNGASSVIMADKDAAERNGKGVLGEIKVVAQVAVPADIMGLGAAHAGMVAIDAFNKKHDGPPLTITDFGVIEVNEAFAGVGLAAMHAWAKKYNVPVEHINAQTNINGGAIALGHPLGATGTRLAATVLYELRRKDARYGLATMCIGGGQGIAIIVENPKGKYPVSQCTISCGRPK